MDESDRGSDQQYKLGEIVSTKNEARFGKVVQRVILPEACITQSQIELSTYTTSRLDPISSRLLTKKWLRSQAKVSVPQGSDGQKFLGLETFGRVMPSAYGKMVVGNCIYSVILEKGGWLSGEKYNKPQPSTNVEGLVELSESRFDASVAEELAECGFRCALPLGRVGLETVETKAFLENAWKRNDAMLIQINDSFRRINESGNVPALDFRLGGVVERIGDVYGVLEENDRNKAAVATASRVVAEEIKQFPDKYSSYLNSPNEIIKYKEVFEKVASRKGRLTEEDYYYFMDYYMAIGKANAQALEKFVDKKRKSGENVVENIENLLSNPKDTDLAGYSYDFDVIEKEKDHSGSPQSATEIKSGYLTNWRFMMQNWEQNVIRDIFAPLGLAKSFDERWPELAVELK